MTLNNVTRLCNATTKRSKTACSNPAVTGSSKCRMHGGKTPTGIASPNFKTGRHSKFLPSQLSEKYDIAKFDRELVGLRDEIALTDVYLSDRLEKLHAGEGENFWRALKTEFARYEKALKDELMPVDFNLSGKVLSADNPCDVLEGIKQLISEGLKESNIYEQVQPMIEQRRKLVDSEAKRLRDMEQNITVEQAMGIIMLLSSVVKKYVTDETQLAAISRELNEAVGKETAA